MVTESSDIADGLVEHHLEGDAVLGSSVEHRWTNDLIPGITETDVTTFIQQLGADRARSIVIMTPARGTKRSLDEHMVLASIDSARSQVADEATDSTAVTVMSRLPEPGMVTSRSTLSEIDVHQWRLSNRMRVLLKPTDFEDDEVELRITAPGGASLAGKADYPSAYMADKVLEVVGAGDLDGSRVARLLDSRAMTLAPIVNDERIGLTGRGRRGDLEVMLQLAHAYLTSPREDTETFARYRERLAAFARNRAADPDAVFTDTVAWTLRPDDPRALRNTTSFVASVDMDRALHFWRDRAKNGSNFTAVIVGDFEVWQVGPLVERYLGSLPAGHPERPADMGFSLPESGQARSFRRGIEPSALTRIIIRDTSSVTLEADAALDATRDLLDMVLHERLREDLAGTYGVSVSVEILRGPRPSFAFSIDFTAAPERIDSLANAALGEIERLRTRGPTPEEVARVRKAAIEHNDEDSHGNGYWANELAWHTLSGWSLESIAQHGEDAKKISAAMLKSACARYLDGRRFVRVTRFPELRADSSGAQ
jgi:zinc protease